MANSLYAKDECKELDVDTNDDSGPTRQLLDKVFLSLLLPLLKSIILSELEPNSL